MTTLTGGNPDLDADRRTVWKLGGNWRPSEKLDLKLRADLVRQSIDTPQIGFPAATPALEAAFPDRFQRDADGQLIARRPAPGQRREARAATRCAGGSISPSRSSPTRRSREQIAALRARFGQRAQPRRAGAPAAADARRSADRRAARRAAAVAAAVGGGRFGGRNGGRLTLSATHTLTFKDELTHRAGHPDARLSRRRGAQLERRAAAPCGRGRERLLQQWPRRAAHRRLAQRDARRRRRPARICAFPIMRRSTCGCSPTSASASTWSRKTRSSSAARCASRSRTSSTPAPRCAAATATSRSPTSPTGSNRSGGRSASASASCSCRTACSSSAAAARRRPRPD